MTTVAAIVFALATSGVVAFQIGLALGAPWGAWAMGGSVPGRFPPRLRVAALAQGILLAGLAAIVLARAEIIRLTIVDDLPSLVWLAVGFSAVGLVLNSISRSAGERRIWVPVSAVMVGASLVVALGPS